MYLDKYNLSELVDMRRDEKTTLARLEEKAAREGPKFARWGLVAQIKISIQDIEQAMLARCEPCEECGRIDPVYPLHMDHAKD